MRKFQTFIYIYSNKIHFEKKLYILDGRIKIATARLDEQRKEKEKKRREAKLKSAKKEVNLTHPKISEEA